MLDDDDLPPGVMRCTKKTKRKQIETWSVYVMGDRPLSGTAVKVAWSLSHRLSDDGRTWEIRQKLARRAGLKVNTVRGALRELALRGHILVRKEYVAQERGPDRLYMVTRPCFSSVVAGDFLAPIELIDLDRGGDPLHPRGGDPLHIGGGDPLHPMNQKGIRKQKNESVAGLSTLALVDEDDDYGF